MKMHVNEEFIIDEYNNKIYTLKAKYLGFKKKRMIYDLNSNEVCFLKYKIWSLLPHYEIYIGGTKVVDIIKDFSFFQRKYIVKGIDWQIIGNLDLWNFNYSITENKNIVATITKEFHPWKKDPGFEIDVVDSKNNLLAISIALAIDVDTRIDFITPY